MNQFTLASSQVDKTVEPASLDFGSLTLPQQLQHGGAAIAGILAVTLLIHALTGLVKACNPK